MGNNTYTSAISQFLRIRAAPAKSSESARCVNLQPNLKLPAIAVVAAQVNKSRNTKPQN